MDNLTQYLVFTTAALIRYGLLAGIPFFLFYKLFFKRQLKAKIQLKVATNKDFIREIGHSLKTTFILAAVGLITLHSPLRQYLQVYSDLSERPLWWIPISVVLSLIIHDTYFYWMHRLAHSPNLFKAIHLVHHKSTNPSPWASYSFQTTEAILEALVLPIILVVIPHHPLSIALFTLSSFVINVYGHLGFEIMPKRFRYSWLFEVINTSVYHNLHHEKFKGNYGLYFRIWDRLLGTEHPDYVKKYDSIQAKRFPTTKIVTT